MNFVPTPDETNDIHYSQSGYYSVNGKKFYKNHQAFNYAYRTQSKVEWYFYDDVWDKAHQQGLWKYQTLDQLYDIRAKQLRQKYDYVAILSSGGWDSRNIIEVFERNNLHIDCIVTFTSSELNSTTSKNSFNPENWNGEIMYHAVPFAMQYVSRHPSTVFLQHEWIADSKRYFQDIDMLMKMIPGRIGLSNARFMSLSTNPEFLRLTENKNVCLIGGADKPCIILDNGAARGFVPEGTVRTNSAYYMSSKGWPSNVMHEHFYWTPDLPEIMVRGWYELLALCNRDPLVRQAHDANESLVARAKSKAGLTVQNKLRQMLYKGFDPNEWQACKAIFSSFFHELDVPIIKMVRDENIPIDSIVGEALIELSKYVGEENIVYTTGMPHSYKPWVDRYITDGETMLDYKSFCTKFIDLDTSFQLTQEHYFS